MARPDSIRVAWRLREPPVAPTLGLYAGPVARALAERPGWDASLVTGLLAESSAGSVVVLLGPTEALPWVEGARWLAPLRDAPLVYAPATHEPSVPGSLFAAALERVVRLPAAVVWPEGWVVPLGGRGPVDPSRLPRGAAGRGFDVPGEAAR